MDVGSIGNLNAALGGMSIIYRPPTMAERAVGETKDGQPVTGGMVKDTAHDPVDKAAPKGECQTCQNRKYQDGSDEQVSFKSAAKINPNAVYARVRGHEQEHVANAFDKAKQEGGKVLQASVAIHYATCPECGRRYVSGGTTTTRIAYPKTKYGQNQKAFDAEATKGNNIDAAC